MLTVTFHAEVTTSSWKPPEFKHRNLFAGFQALMAPQFVPFATVAELPSYLQFHRYLCPLQLDLQPGLALAAHLLAAAQLYQQRHRQ